MMDIFAFTGYTHSTPRSERKVGFRMFATLSRTRQYHSIRGLISTIRWEFFASFFKSAWNFFVNFITKTGSTSDISNTLL